MTTARTRTIHFRPPEVTRELLDGRAEKPGDTERSHKTQASGHRPNPIDALGAIGRDVALLHQVAESLIRDADGRHGNLHVMRRAVFRLQENIKLLIDLEEQ